jgi:hypothetical protein
MGEKLRGVVKATYVRGREAFAAEKFAGEPMGAEVRL